MSKKITSTSYSRYATYTQCPLKAKLKFVDKLPDPPGPAAERGTHIHKLAEDYVKGSIKKLPSELKLFKDWFAYAMKNNSGVLSVEENWAFSKAFNECVDWFDWGKVWCRVKVDLVFTHHSDEYRGEVMEVVDHKTGKPRNEQYEDQLELSALAAFHQIETAPDIAIAGNWYIDHGPDFTNEIVVHRKDVPRLERRWSKKFTPMLNDTKFAPRPGQHCRWCPYAKSKGGPCKFG